MKIKRIGFGYVKSLGNYENCKVWMEADLEDWEDPSESLNHLRSQVAQELDLADKWHDLKGKFNRQLQALEATNAALTNSQEKLKKAQEEWKKYAAFLARHGIDPETLKVDSYYNPENLGKKALKLHEFCVRCVETDNFAGFIQEIQHILREDIGEAENLAHEPKAINEDGNYEPVFVGNEYDGCFDDDDDDDFDPYYGDEYDRIHDQAEETENSYF